MTVREEINEFDELEIKRDNVYTISVSLEDREENEVVVRKFCRFDERIMILCKNQNPGILECDEWGHAEASPDLNKEQARIVGLALLAFSEDKFNIEEE